MTRDDIIHMARLIFGCAFDDMEDYYEVPVSGLLDCIERFAHLVAKHEREGCAKLCELQEDFEYATGKVDHNERSWCGHLAAAIRARSEE